MIYFVGMRTYWIKHYFNYDRGTTYLTPRMTQSFRTHLNYMMVDYVMRIDSWCNDYGWIMAHVRGITSINRTKRGIQFKNLKCPKNLSFHWLL